MHWVVATCCYAPGLLLIAEQRRRAAFRNVKKGAEVHLDEFTKITDKGNDKQPLLKEGGTLADAYSSLIVLLQFGRTTCWDMEAKLWSLYASLMMATCAIRLCYKAWAGEEPTESWTVAVVVLLMSVKISHRWWAVRDVLRDFEVAAQARSLSCSQRSDEGKDAAKHQRASGSIEDTTNELEKKLAVDLNGDGYIGGLKGAPVPTPPPERLPKAAELCDLMAQAVEEHPELPDTFHANSVLMTFVIGTLTDLLVVTSLGCDFVSGAEDASWCENFDLAQTSWLDFSVAVWYFFFGMIMLTACTVWDTLILVYPIVAKHHIKLVCGRVKTQPNLPQMCEQAEGFAKLVRVNKLLCDQETVTQACETINSFLLLVLLCETDLGFKLNTGDAINAWAWFIVFMFLSATQLIALARIDNSFADEVSELKCSIEVLKNESHQVMFEHLLPAWRQRVRFKLWFGIGLTMDGVMGFMGSLIGVSVLALSGLS